MTAATPHEAAPAYADLRGLRTVADSQWIAYLATYPADDRHVVLPLRLGRGWAPRTLLRGEAYQWCEGLCWAAGGGDLVARVADEALPELVAMADVPGMIPAVDGRGGKGGPWLTRQGVAWNVNAGNFYTLYGRGRRSRWLFADQVRAEAAERRVQAAARAGATKRRLAALVEQEGAARAKWLEVRKLLPPPTRPAAAEVDLRPKPSPDPLPIGQGLPGVTRRVEALMVAADAGWLEYLHPDGDVYVVRIAGAEVRVGEDAVLPWLLGVADWHCRADLIAYRPDLG